MYRIVEVLLKKKKSTGTHKYEVGSGLLYLDVGPVGSRVTFDHADSTSTRLNSYPVGSTE